jgi:ATP-binding cassette, subfamily B, bacterial PglK
LISYVHQIFHLLGQDRRKLPFILLMFLGTSLFDLVGLGLIGPFVALVVDPQALGGTIGQIVVWIGLPRDQQLLLKVLGLGLFCIFLLKAVSSVYINWVIVRFSQLQQLRLRTHLMQSFQAMPYTEYLGRNSSEYIHSIQALTGQYSAVVLMTLRSTGEIIVGLVILAVLSWANVTVLALLVVMLGIIIFSYDRLFSKKLRNYGQRINIASVQIVQGIHEGIEGLKEIRILGQEEYFLKKVRDGAQQQMIFQTRLKVIEAVPRYILELIMISFVVLLLLGMLWLGHDTKMLLPTLGIFGVALIRLLPSANLISASFIQLRFSRDHVSRLYQDIEHLEQMKFESSLKSESPFAGLDKSQILVESFLTLKLENISFSYPNALVCALQGVTFQIRQGESVGIIGTSGAGKTTLVDILLGLLEPQAGNILFNGRPLRERLFEWRSQSAYLPQQVFLIDNTLKRNIALGVEDAEIDETLLHEALQKARLSEMLLQLPNGVDTLLGERGVRLSGGQRQRVALARAFYHRREVLVMDEATSALDNKTEHEIVEEIKHLKGQITMIVIAHRITTVQNCDRIIRLEQGQIVEEGTPSEILSKLS